MWGRGAGMGLYVAAVTQEQQIREQALAQRRIRQLNQEMAEQQAQLVAWLQDPNNRRFSYYADVSAASQMLTAPFASKPVMSDVQSRVDDLEALNDALLTNDVADLLERAKAHMEYYSPAAIGLGVAFAVIGIGICVATACMPLAIFGLMAIVGGVVGVSVGATKVPSEKTFLLFNVARKIDPDVDQQRDLQGIDIDAELNLPDYNLGMA